MSMPFFDNVELATLGFLVDTLNAGRGNVDRDEVESHLEPLGAKQRALAVLRRFAELGIVKEYDYDPAETAFGGMADKNKLRFFGFRKHRRWEITGKAIEYLHQTKQDAGPDANAKPQVAGAEALAAPTLDEILREFQGSEVALRDNPDCKNSLGLACAVWRNFPKRMWEIESAARKAGPRMGDVFGTTIDWTEGDRGKAVSALNELHVRATAVLVRFAKLFEYDPKPIAVSSTYCRQFFREGRVPSDLPLSEDALWWPDLLEVKAPRADAIYTESLAAWNTVRQLRDKARCGGFDPVELPTQVHKKEDSPEPQPIAPPEGANRNQKRKGRPVDTNLKEDAQIFDAWKTGRYANYEELGRQFHKTTHEAGKIIDREGKRRKRDADSDN